MGGDEQIHWFSIINSVMIVLFLSGMVAMIMMRTLHRDISKYNQLETAEEAQEETGWKLVCLSRVDIGKTTVHIARCTQLCTPILLKCHTLFSPVSHRYMVMSFALLHMVRSSQHMWALACSSLA